MVEWMRFGKENLINMNNKKSVITAAIFLLIAVVFTILVKFIGVADTGLLDSKIGLAKFNLAFRDFIGYSDTLAKISKYMIVIPFGLALCYVILGIIELSKHKSMKKISSDYYFYLGSLVLVVLIYAFFEFVIVNYRPILEDDGTLGASFPSSHTLIAVAICGISVIMNKLLLERKVFFFKSKEVVLNLNVAIVALGILAVVTRLFSGVHWLTDIVGGILYGAFIIAFFDALTKNFNKKEQN